MTIGKTIASLRSNMGLTQRELAKKLDVSSGAVGMWESEKRQPDIDTIIKIAQFFNVSTDYLFGMGNLDQDGICESLNFSSDEEQIFTPSNKLAYQLDVNCIVPSKLAKDLNLSLEIILKWISGEEDFSNYYQQLSEYFHVLPRYWTSPGAISPGIEPNEDEYFLVLVYRAFLETGHYVESLPRLEDFFGDSFIATSESEIKYLNTFRELSEDNQDIIIGRMKELLKEQRYEDPSENGGLREAK